MMRQLAMTQAQMATPTTLIAIITVCGICSLNTHSIHACPTLQEKEPILQTYAAGNLPNKP